MFFVFNREDTKQQQQQEQEQEQYERLLLRWTCPSLLRGTGYEGE